MGRAVQDVYPVNQFAEIVVWSDTRLTTPYGQSSLAEVEIGLGPSVPITRSTPTWSAGLVIVALIVGLFTCGLGLLLLFLARTERTYTVMLETVTVKGPGFEYHTQADGGAAFVSWAVTWQQQIRAQNYNYQLPTTPHQTQAIRNPLPVTSDDPNATRPIDY